MAQRRMVNARGLDSDAGAGMRVWQAAIAAADLASRW
jgi:hypothetical protein